MTAPVNNFSVGAAKPPEMTDKEIRLECLKQAVILKTGSGNVIGLAQQMTDFVMSGSTP